MSPVPENITSCTKPKLRKLYIPYCIVVREGLSHRHMQRAQEICCSCDMRFWTVESRHTDKLNNWLQYSAPVAGRGEVNRPLLILCIYCTALAASTPPTASTISLFTASLGSWFVISNNNWVFSLLPAPIHDTNRRILISEAWQGLMTKTDTNAKLHGQSTKITSLRSLSAHKWPSRLWKRSAAVNCSVKCTTITQPTNQSISEFLKWPKWCNNCKDH